jgi:acetyl-CoA carboxylase carboxyltransferase component
MMAKQLTGTTNQNLAELRARLEQAKEPGGEQAAAKRDAKGIPSARARIDALLDPGSSWRLEHWSARRVTPTRSTATGLSTAMALSTAALVGAFSHDQTVFGGSVGEMFGRKVARLMEWCARAACPIIGINDSGGARIQDAVTSLAWYAKVGFRHEMLSGLVPQISLIVGKCAGGAVYSPIQTDLVLAVRDQGYMFINGPDIIKDVTGEEITFDELGGADAQARYGNIHRVVESEAAAFQYVRDFLSFLPSNCFDDPPTVNPGLEPEITPHDLELDAIVPDADNTSYDMHEILLRIFDDGYFLEVGAQARAGDHHRLRPYRRTPSWGRGQPANAHVWGDRQRSLRQGRAVRAVLQLPQHAAGVRCRHTRIPARSKRRTASSNAAGDSSSPSGKPTSRR